MPLNESLIENHTEARGEVNFRITITPMKANKQTATEHPDVVNMY